MKILLTFFLLLLFLYSSILNAKTIFENKIFSVNLIDIIATQKNIQNDLVISFNIEYQITNKSNHDIKMIDHKLLGINDLFNDVLFSFKNLNLIKDVYVTSLSTKKFVHTFVLNVNSKNIIQTQEALKRLKLISLEDLLINYQVKKLINAKNEIIYFNDLKLEIKKSDRKLTINEIDFFRQQISSCWKPPLSANNMDDNMYVKIFLEVDKNRNVIRETIELVDTNIPRSKMYYEPIIDSALNAFLNPECSQLNLPKDKYQTWKNLTITFDYSMY